MGRADGQGWLSRSGVGREREKEEGQDTENIEITNNINKLDKDTLNMYTAPRAYG
jgi:hypothetical protein